MLFDKILAVVRLFELPDGKICLTPIHSGRINYTYHISVIEPAGCVGEYILQEINVDVFPNPHLIMQNLDQLLQHHHYPGLDLVKSTNGKTWVSDSNGRYFRMFSYIENSAPSHTPDSHIYFEAGEAVGVFHSRFWNFDARLLHPTIAGFHDTPKRLARFLDVVERAATQVLHEAQKEISFVKNWSGIAHLITQKLSTGVIPYRVTHNDTKLENILFDQAGNAISLIDFDTVMPGAIAWDVGDSIRSMANRASEEETDVTKAGLQFPHFQAFISGYAGIMDGYLSVEEVNSLVEGCLVIPYEQGMRFLTDYLQGDQYYSIQYPNQNLIRSRIQFKFLTEVLSRKEEMNIFLRKAFPLSLSQTDYNDSSKSSIVG